MDTSRQIMYNKSLCLFSERGFIKKGFCVFINQTPAHVVTKYYSPLCFSGSILHPQS